jgi:hypothetical protein
MRRIEVFVAGAQKGGTTTMHAYLRQHPALSPPSQKELHVFDNEALDWIRPDQVATDQFYSAEDEGRMRFDATPIYSFWQPSLRRIRAHNPEAKLIFLFRDPFARAWSHWCMEYARGADDMPFAKAIREGRRRMSPQDPLGQAMRVYSYVERGYYARQVIRALSLFPRENLLFLKSEDFAYDHMASLNRITDFLRIDPFSYMPELRENARSMVAYPSVPTMADRALVQAELAQDRAAFACLTGLDVREWDGTVDMPALPVAAE